MGNERSDDNKDIARVIRVLELLNECASKEADSHYKHLESFDKLGPNDSRIKYVTLSRILGKHESFSRSRDTLLAAFPEITLEEYEPGKTRYAVRQ